MGVSLNEKRAIKTGAVNSLYADGDVVRCVRTIYS